jgi:hypothetical protein
VWLNEKDDSRRSRRVVLEAAADAQPPRGVHAGQRRSPSMKRCPSGERNAISRQPHGSSLGALRTSAPADTARAWNSSTASTVR